MHSKCLQKIAGAVQVWHFNEISLVSESPTALSLTLTAELGSGGSVFHIHSFVNMNFNTLYSLDIFTLFHWGWLFHEHFTFG